MTNGIYRDALTFAQNAHEGQVYGANTPYYKHILDAVAIASEFGVENDCVYAAVALHDVVEDTEIEIDEIDERFGFAIANLVYAVSKPKGKSRREAEDEYYRQIRAARDAVVIKLADRIANVRNAWETQNTVLFMYFQEYKKFRSELKGKSPMSENNKRAAKLMWKELDALMGMKK